MLVEALRVLFRGRHEIRLIAKIQTGLLQQLGHHGGAGAMHANDGDWTGSECLVRQRRSSQRSWIPYRREIDSNHLEPMSPDRHHAFGE